MVDEARSEVCAPWVTPDRVSGLPTPVDEGLLSDCLHMASDVLFNFTRRRWPGECTDTIRPCIRARGPLPVGFGMWWGLSSTAVLSRCGVAVEQPACGCGWLDEIPLPGFPVVAISEVKVNGEIVDPSKYTVRDRRHLVAIGGQHWPTCQVLSRPDTEQGTFSVEYAFGNAPPVGGVLSAAGLASQLYLLFTPPDPDKPCRLPKRVTTIARQGVTVAVLDPMKLFADGQTGLAEVDMWVASVNRGGNQRGATIIDPARVASSTRFQ